MKSVRLSRRELICSAMFAGGFTFRQIASILGLGNESVKSYIKRARQKFSDAGYGREVSTKVGLLRHMERGDTWTL